MVTATKRELRPGLPVCGQQRGEVVLVGHGRQAGEDVAQISERFDAVAQARDDDRVEDGAALAGVGMADEQPVLPADGGGTHGVFDQVVVEPGLAVLDVARERAPLAEQITGGQTEPGLGPVPRPGGKMTWGGQRWREAPDCPCYDIKP